MKKHILILLSFLVLYGCSTNVAVKDDLRFADKIPFAAGKVINQCGVNPEGAKDAATIMAEAIAKELATSDLPQGTNGYSIDTTIEEYEPGDAFKRWLMPGWGATNLVVQVSIKDLSGSVVGEMKISRNIAAGGGYTIGAWEYVFTDVAKAIIEELKKRIVV